MLRRFEEFLVDIVEGNADLRNVVEQVLNQQVHRQKGKKGARQLLQTARISRRGLLRPCEETMNSRLRTNCRIPLQPGHRHGFKPFLAVE